MDPPNIENRKLPIVGDQLVGRKGLWKKKTVEIIDTKLMATHQSLLPKPSKHHFTSFAFHDGRELLAATGNSVYLWDLRSGKRLHGALQPPRELIDKWLRLSRGGYAPSACAFSASGDLLAVGTRAGCLLVFDVASGDMSHVLESSQTSLSYIRHVNFLGDSPFVLAISSVARVYDTHNRAWLSLPVFGEMRAKTINGTVAIDGRSIFVVDCDGNLYEYEWSLHDEQEAAIKEAEGSNESN